MFSHSDKTLETATSQPGDHDKHQLRWFGHPECTDDIDYIKCQTMIEGEGVTQTEHLRKTYKTGTSEGRKLRVNQLTRIHMEHGS